ncbi:hypothetical protein C8R47DRAFT_611791 [Mycena vitilis]|nr:hypothetical protein C8R47DRAFT_611791 [Mycena vitilis]
MPYSDPGVVVSPPPQHQHQHQQAPQRPGHRRSYTFAADDPRAGPGAFASLGALPRRTRSHVASPQPSSQSASQATSSAQSNSGTSTARKFHFRGDVDNDDSSSSSDEPASSSLPGHGQGADDDDGPPPPLRLRQPPAFRLTPATGGSFHRASPPRSPQRSPNSSSVNVNVSTNTLSAPNAGAGPVPFPRSSSPLSPTFADAVAYNTALSVNPNYPAPYASPSPAYASSFHGDASSFNTNANGYNGAKRPAGPARTSSTPLILLSNGKPLKSSLKSSSSAPHFSGQGQGPSHHLRARSAPSTPCLAGVGGGAMSPEADAESPGTPTSKAVHFPAPDAGLEDIRLFKRSARPASVSFPLDEETETETEGEGGGGGNVRWSGGVFAAGGGSASDRERGYPFPRVVRSPLNPLTRTTGVGARHPHHGHTAVHHSMLSPSLQPPHSARAVTQEHRGGAEGEEGLPWRYALHAPGIPRAVDREREGGSMVLVEGLGFADPTNPSSSNNNNVDSELTLHGTLLARNAAFEKHVFVRFTLDGWCTTSEVGARWVGAAAAAESPFGANWGKSNNSSSQSNLNSHLSAGGGAQGTQDGGNSGQGEGGGEGGQDGGEQGKEEPGPGWDRFAFSIRLTDYAHSRGGGSSSGDPRLRETGLGGIGRGLEGRELVLVGRFFAPWVRAGGVGPYQWCDTLSPSSTSPATQAGTDVSPSGRAWVGFGNGGQAGSGEWWDNNGGKDYRVGFRCVAVEEDTPISTPLSTAPTVNAIPFPSAESPVTTTTTPAPTISLSASSAIPPSAPISPLVLPQAMAMNGTQANGSPYPSPTHANGSPTQGNGSTPPPPPPPRTAHAQALAAKLGRLNLRNYAAPRAVSLPGGVGAGAPVVAPALAPLVSPLKVEVVEESVESVTEETSQESKEQKSQSGEAANEKEEEKEEEKEKLQPAPGQSSGGIGLYWPWGRVSAASPPAVVRTSAPSSSTPPTSPPSDDGDADSSSDDDDAASSLMSSSHILQSSSSSAETEMEAETPPTSPLGAGGLLPLIEGMLPPVIEGMPRFEGGGEDEVTPTNENGWTNKQKEAAKVPLPVSPPTLSPLSSGASTPRTSPPSTTSASPPPVSAPLLPSAADASSSLYKAFVRQWCFAGNGSASGGNGAKGVVGV